MERTHLPLHKWFYAMYLFSTSRHGVAAKEFGAPVGHSLQDGVAHGARDFASTWQGRRRNPLGVLESL